MRVRFHELKVNDQFFDGDGRLMRKDAKGTAECLEAGARPGMHERFSSGTKVLPAPRGKEATWKAAVAETGNMLGMDS